MENKYLLHGKLTAKAGQQKELANILIQASQMVSMAKGQELEILRDLENKNE